MKVAFLGCTKFSEELLKSIIETKSCEVSVIFSIPEKFRINYSQEAVINSNYADLSKYASILNVPHYLIDGEQGSRISDYKSMLSELEIEVILVMGWYYMVPKGIRNIAKYGAWGIHASLLPNYAGGAPLVWAIIEGQEKTGVTLFKLDNGVDDGDIIRQAEFNIEKVDDIASVYEKATVLSKKILNEALNLGERNVFEPQKKNEVKIYPQRSPEDGEINLEWDSERIFNFVRAQSSPYPGAFIRTVDGKKIVIEKARIID